MSDPRKQAIINALRAFIEQRPGFEFANYGSMSTYRQDQRRAQRQLHDARELLRTVELRESITADMILKEAGSGRVTIKACSHGESAACRCGGCDARWCAECAPAPSAMCHKCNGGERNPMRPNEVRVDYCTGQYFPTEFRGAVARLMASVLWTWTREQCMPCAPGASTETWGLIESGKHRNAGDWLRAHFKREFGKALADRYFN